VLKILWASGVRRFDVASIREMDLVATACPDAVLYLMNPVKSRATIRHAYRLGVRDLAFDSKFELQKIIDETNQADDLNLHLRVQVSQGDAAMPLAGKFGAGFDDAVTLLQTARPLAAKLGICFHVGSQCMEPDAFANALHHVRALVDTAGIAIDLIDCGGGFPVAYPGMTSPPLQTYFDAISDALSETGFGALDILAEPGRAICAEGGSTLARVDLRRGNDLYLNDGAYGSLYDAANFAWKYPVKRHRLTPASSDGPAGSFRFFGPTCDSTDMMAGPFELPHDICEGDWIEICHLGAYGQAMATGFNGFQSDATIAVLTA
ncbi:MAG: type III PLP-dependent enzyme, partial [Pseudomonadota bacterium]